MVGCVCQENFLYVLIFRNFGRGGQCFLSRTPDPRGTHTPTATMPGVGFVFKTLTAYRGQWGTRAPLDTWTRDTAGRVDNKGNKGI